MNIALCWSAGMTGTGFYKHVAPLERKEIYYRDLLWDHYRIHCSLICSLDLRPGTYWRIMDTPYISVNTL